MRRCTRCRRRSGPLKVLFVMYVHCKVICPEVSLPHRGGVKRANSNKKSTDIDFFAHEKSDLLSSKCRWVSGGRTHGNFGSLPFWEFFGVAMGREVGYRSPAVSRSPAATSGVSSALTRSRYQTTIVASENTKIMVETALISGVIPRRSLPQISSGKVLSRPIRKKLTERKSVVYGK